jgi:hypothetical protein
MIVLDMTDARKLLQSGVTHSDDPAIQAWISYAMEAQKPNSGGEGDAQQQALWKAHQISLHRGIRAAANYFAKEYDTNKGEAAFDEVVVANVDMAALHNQGTASGWNSAGLLNLGVSATYSSHYSADEADAFGSAWWGIGFNAATGHWDSNVGIGSTRWNY